MVVQTRIADYIHDRGIINRHVAEKAGITVFRFSDIMNNRTELKADEFENICIALGVCPSEFIKFPLEKIE